VSVLYFNRGGVGVYMTIVLCRPEMPQVNNHKEYVLISNLKILGQQANGRFAWSGTIAYRSDRRSKEYKLLPLDK